MVSVAISAYNVAEFIGPCVESVLAQTYPDFEIIVVDDGSTDDTLGVVERYADSRVRTIRCETAHGGPSRARNLGVAAARGRFVMILDGDDYLAPRALEWIMAFVEASPQAGLMFFNNEDLDLEGRNVGPYLKNYESFWRLKRTSLGAAGDLIDDPDRRRQLIAVNYIRTSGVTVPRDVFDRLGTFDESMTNADDRDMWLRIAAEYPLGFIDQPGAVHRDRSGSISSRGGRLIRNRIRVLEKQRELASPDDELLQETISLMLSLNHFLLAYELRVESELESAEDHYRKSLHYKPNWRAVKGIAVTRLTKILKPAKRSSRRRRESES
jgi:glycosyltransferase involved in cell wall biosynthesis